MDRQQLRQQICAKRSSLSADAQKISSEQLVANILAQPIYKKSKTIAIYFSVNGEIAAHSLFQQPKRFYLPVLDPQQSRHLFFMRYSLSDQLIKNKYNILEPVFDKNKIIAAENLDLILVPLVAFDLHGNRLGMGAGYYDFTFAFLNNTPRPVKPYLLGLAYDWQRVEELKSEAWDVRLNGVVTDKRVYEF